jgi:uncharacterized secreted protein with C-terminal beta-propeller domain
MKRSKVLLCFLLAVLLILSVNLPVIAADSSTDTFRVSGYVLPDISVDQTTLATVCKGIKIEIDGTKLSASTDEKGYFEISNVPANMDGYRVKLSKKNYLTRYIDKVQVAGDVQVSSADAPVAIWPGDIPRDGVQDDSINLADVMSVATAFNCSAASPKYVKDFDMNLDGAINMSDILSIAKFFNKASSNYLKYFIPLPVIGSSENLTKLLSLLPQSTGEYYYDTAWGGAVPGGVVPPPSMSTPAPAVNGGTSGSTVDYSKVNNQVEGVDEADVVQTDGEYIYQVNKNRIIVAKAYPASEMSVVNEISFSNDPTFTPSQLLIGDRKLIVIGQTTIRTTVTPVPTLGTPPPSGGAPVPYVPAITYYSTKTVTKAIIFDIKDNVNISKLREVEIEGRYLSSRKTGSYLYLVANKSIAYQSKEQPVYRDSRLGNDAKVIDFCSIHYFPEVVRQNYMSIAGLNVDDPNSKVFVSSYLGGGQNMYVSQNNIYIAETNYFSSPIILPAATASTAVSLVRPPYNTQNTMVYKFAMENGNVTFAGKGEVPGNILNQFSMDEYRGYFRIATTVGSLFGTGENISKNNLYITDGEFKITGKIEDIAPGEKIYSTRFMGDRGYMVTFKKIDPLFVFDLKDPADPVILGKLKIPGYSDYLHPYDENHIIGFGKDTIESSYGTNAWYQGMKVALFDITDVNNPVEKFKVIIGDRGTDSELLTNHKALMFSKSKSLMAFPVTLMEIPEEIKKSAAEQSISPQYGQFTFQGAYVYNIDLEKGFLLKGRITHIPDEQYIKAGSYYSRTDNHVERAMYINDTLYTLSRNKIKANKLEDLSEISTLSISQPTTSPVPTPYPAVN